LKTGQGEKPPYEDLLSEYFTSRTSLEALAERHGTHATTLEYQFSRLLKGLPSGLSVSIGRREKLGRFLGVDATFIPIDGLHHTCYLAIELETKDPIHYSLLPGEENSQDAVRFLMEIKYVLYYYPKVVVCDLSQSWLKAIREVFPQARIQACTVHRKRNFYELVKVRRVPKELLPLRFSVRRLIFDYLQAKTDEEQKNLLDKLMSQEGEWRKDGELTKAIQNFLNAREYYNSMEKLGGCPTSNNACESHFSKFKKRCAGEGKKTPASVERCLNGLWHYHRLSIKPDRSNDSISYLASEFRVLKGLTSLLSVSPDQIAREAEEKGMIVVKSGSGPICVFTKDEFEQVYLDSMEHGVSPWVGAESRTIERIWPKGEIPPDAQLSLKVVNEYLGEIMKDEIERLVRLHNWYAREYRRYLLRRYSNGILPLSGITISKRLVDYMPRLYKPEEREKFCERIESLLGL